MKKRKKDLENSIQSLEAKIALTENEKRKLEQDKQDSFHSLVSNRND